ncbi:hypothetical protein N7466_008635 [Penicillium verhagenii]|uniref:uncharacterized protein n=1 Tax=Penicillium verhagenii TaxID=1562060 RepID=UPI0025450325|nr:uncharacterized protein N7466_008635 [Penicillium verhagenii]KAJ5924448.1 hypothetical protein N7466_008635 [Penicillium verhagenii]
MGSSVAGEKRKVNVLSRLSSLSGFHDLDVLGSGCDGYEVEGLRLNEPGEEGADDPGVELAVAEAAVSPIRIEAAAAAGLQCAHTKMLKPRPSQLVQIAPLEK